MTNGKVKLKEYQNDLLAENQILLNEVNRLKKENELLKDFIKNIKNELLQSN